MSALPQTSPKRRLRRLAAMGILMLLAAAFPAAAQQPPGGVYYPLDQTVPPGVAGNWSVILGKATPGYFQPVRFELPSQGHVSVFGPFGTNCTTLVAPAQIGLAVGHVYRLKISHMPEFPGVELYPSVELIDRLHPPEGLQQEFPIPVQFTDEEIALALAGRLVTRVVYLEQPQLAMPQPQLEGPPVRTIPSRQNLLAEADRAGRPMLILRLGGRLPAVHGEDPAFFGTGAPVAVPNGERRQP